MFWRVSLQLSRLVCIVKCVERLFDLLRVVLLCLASHCIYCALGVALRCAGLYRAARCAEHCATLCCALSSSLLG